MTIFRATRKAPGLNYWGRVASDCFRSYVGHYHADPRLDPVGCDSVNSSWAKNSLGKGGLADAVISIKKNEDIAAFATLKKLNNKDFEGVLFSASFTHQKNDLHLNLMMLSKNWGVVNNLKTFLTSTHINNTEVQKNWCRVGLEPANSFYTSHLW